MNWYKKRLKYVLSEVVSAGFDFTNDYKMGKVYQTDFVGRLRRDEINDN